MLRATVAELRQRLARLEGAAAGADRKEDSPSHEQQGMSDKS